MRRTNFSASGCELRETGPRGGEEGSTYLTYGRWLLDLVPFLTGLRKGTNLTFKSEIGSLNGKMKSNGRLTCARKLML